MNFIAVLFTKCRKEAFAFCVFLFPQPCYPFFSGATKVTACGRTLIRSSKMASGAPGANLAPARARVELEFASGHVSATTQRK